MFGKNDAKKGMIVRRATGEKLGPVSKFEGDALIIDGGRKLEYVAKLSQVEGVRNGEIWLRERIGSSPIEAGGSNLDIEGFRRIPLVEEELDVTKRQREAGEVRIHKTVTEERRDISVPVMKEEVHVERVPASGDARTAAADASGATFREETVSVPVMEEEVEIRKRPVVREELRVSKERHVEQRAASETVRREDADVEGGERVVRRGGEDTGPKRHT